MEPQTTVEALVDDYYGYIVNICHKYFHDPDEVEDAAQEIVIKLILSLETFRGGSSISTWVYSVARNHVLDRLKKREQALDAYLDELPDPRCDHDERREEALGLSLGLVRAMIRVLTRRERQVYALSRLFGCSGPEGAAILGLTPANFRQILSRVDKKLNVHRASACVPSDGRWGIRCAVSADDAKTEACFREIQTLPPAEKPSLDEIRTILAERKLRFFAD